MGIANMNKGKISVSTQLEDTKALADAENKDRSSLLTKYKMMATDLENFREKLENENARKSDGLKALSKAQAEIQLWKSKFETEGLGRIEELEGGRNKLTARLAEAEETIETLNQKVASTEKTKHRLETELEDIQLEYERVHAAAIITEKRGRNFDKVIGEWKAKADDLVDNIDASQKECRNYSSELFRLKAAHDEITEQLDIVKRENKNLADEIKDLLDQLGDGGRSIHDLDKQRRRLEQEKEELQAALEEAEATLEMEENKVLRAQLELAQVKQDIDRRVAEKEDEFNNTRKNHARAMDSIGASIETEQRAKGEALRIKKQLEGEINELEIGLDHANKANSEGLKSVKRYQNQLRETIQAFEDEARSRAQIIEQVGICERKAAALSGEVEESKALLDSAGRTQRQLQNDIADSRAAVNNMQTINARDMTAKRQLESSIHTLQAEVDGMLVAAKNAEEKAKKAMVDAARLADELRAEQEHVSTLGTGKNSLSNALGELEGRLSDAENAALKGGKTPWPSSRARSASSRLSWPPPSPALVRPPRPSREPSARPRSSPSPRVRTRRTRTACLSSPPSCRTRSRPTSSRLRRLRRSPPSTWPSSARPSRSSRRPRSAPSSPWFCKLMNSYLSMIFSIPLSFKLSKYLIFTSFSV